MTTPADTTAAPAIKSRPTYRALTLDPTGARHLLLADQPALPPQAARIDTDPVQIWLAVADSRAIPGPADLDHAAPRHRRFRSIAQMLARLSLRLQAERMGLRLYAIGTEAFVWDVGNLGQAAGMGKHEIHLAHAGSRCRRVICVHCRTVIERVTTSIVPCPGCQAALFVRDHFSRSLGGFQGVQVDAEIPGAVPAAEAVYR